MRQLAPPPPSGGPPPPAAGAPGAGAKPAILIVCTYFRRDRTPAPDRDFLQPLAGVHVGSCIDHAAYDVRLYHEMWHGAFDTGSIEPGRYALVFLTGLQQDFDRMRQLSFFFRRAGARVVAGGSVCTSFPEFATQFFDAVCVGGVETTFDVIRDFEAGGKLRPIYRARAAEPGRFRVAYHLLAKAGIDVPIHLIEASRGCSFKCSFCIMPPEFGRHTSYGVDLVRDAIDRSIAESPRWSIRRLFPMLWFMDNNFSDDPAYLRAVCAMLRAHPKVRAWGCLITQNVLRDHALIATMARAGCRAIFVGIESFDEEFLRATRKRQNLSRTQSVLDDVMFAERQGIVIAYSLLVDPRMSDLDKVRRDLLATARDGRIPLPCFISFISPLVGTEMFWECIERDELRPGLRMRELDGETIAFRHTREALADVVAFGRVAFGATWQMVPRHLVLWNVARRMLRARCWNPLRWLVAVQCSWRVMAKSTGYDTRAARNYLGGEDRLDPQYESCPADASPDERARYFAPVLLTEPDGSLAEWMRPYRPGAKRAPAAAARERELELPVLR